MWKKSRIRYQGCLLAKYIFRWGNLYVCLNQFQFKVPWKEKEERNDGLKWVDFSLREKCSPSEFFWSVFSTNVGKIRTRKTPNTDTFHAWFKKCQGVKFKSKCTDHKETLSRCQMTMYQRFYCKLWMCYCLCYKLWIKLKKCSSATLLHAEL